MKMNFDGVCAHHMNVHTHNSLEFSSKLWITESIYSVLKSIRTAEPWKGWFGPRM